MDPINECRSIQNTEALVLDNALIKNISGDDSRVPMRVLKGGAVTVSRRRFSDEKAIMAKTELDDW